MGGVPQELLVVQLTGPVLLLLLLGQGSMGHCGGGVAVVGAGLAHHHRGRRRRIGR